MQISVLLLIFLLHQNFLCYIMFAWIRFIVCVLNYLEFRRHQSLWVGSHYFCNDYQTMSNTSSQISAVISRDCGHWKAITRKALAAFYLLGPLMIFKYEHFYSRSNLNGALQPRHICSVAQLRVVGQGQQHDFQIKSGFKHIIISAKKKKKKKKWKTWNPHLPTSNS